MWEGYVIDDCPVGKWKFYWDNGNIKDIRNYQLHPTDKWRSVIVGKAYAYHYINGKLHYEYSYNELGYLEGKSKSYYEDGKTLSGIYHYSFDKVDGIVMLWDKQGNLLAHKKFSEGKLVQDFLE